MTRNIDFSRKQKLEDDYDQGKYEEIGENIHEYIKSPMPHRSTLNLKNINKKEEEENLETAKNKNNKNENKLTKRNNSYRGKEANNNLDIIQYTKKKKKKSKPCKDIPIKTYKKNKSKPDIRKPKSINLK